TYAGGMNVAMNYYFIAASVLLLTIVGAWVTEKIVEPRLGSYDGIYKEKLEGLKPIEKKGLTWASVGFGVVIVGILLLILPNKDRKSTRLNSSHVSISYAVFFLKKKPHISSLIT